MRLLQGQWVKLNLKSKGRIKIMKILLIAIICILSFNLSACNGNTNKSLKDISIYQTTINEIASNETEIKNTESNDILFEDNFDVDSKLVNEFGKKVKESVAKKDIEELSNLVAYPVYIGFPDEGIIIENKEDFVLIDKERFFTQEMLTSIELSDEATLEPSMAGFTLMSSSENSVPSITFSIVNGKLGIVGINY